MAFLAAKLPSLRAISMAALAVACAIQLRVVTGSLERLVAIATYDDTFLYLTVARNLAAHGFPSFDGETLTNGFQPLWGAVMAATAYVIRDRDLLLRAACLICVCLNVATGLLIIRIGQALRAAAIGWMAAVVWSCFLMWPRSITGTEASLHGFVFALIGLAAVRWWDAGADGRGRPSAWLLGALLALNALCRLDSALVSGLIALALTRKLPRRRFVDGVIPLLLPLLAFLAAYVLTNSVIFGTAAPVSGTTKIFWAHEAKGLPLFADLSGALLGSLQMWGQSMMALTGLWDSRPRGVVVPLVTAGLTAAVVLGVMAARKASVSFIPVAGLLLALAIHTLFLHILLRGFAFASWYYQPLRMTVALAVGFTAFLLSQPRHPLASRSLGTLLIVAILGLSIGRSVLAMSDASWKGDLFGTRLHVAEWISQSDLLDADWKIGAWNSGQLGYFCTRPIVNLDGFVQGPRFLDEVLRPGRWRPYFQQHRLGYLVDYNRADATQTSGGNWDRERWFRRIVPMQRARVIKRSGSILVVDIRPWLETDP